jgi:hypothetical protein
VLTDTGIIVSGGNIKDCSGRSFTPTEESVGHYSVFFLV